MKLEQIFQGLEEFGTETGDVDFAAFAKACGGFGRRVEEPSALPNALGEVMDSKIPSILDVVVSSEQLPIF